MPAITEGRHTAEFLISDAAGHRSRDVGTLAKGNNLQAGTVLGASDSNGNYGALNTASTAGYQNAAAILYDTVDATDNAAKVTVITRDAEVDGGALTFPDGITDADKQTAIDALAAAGIVVR